MGISQWVILAALAGLASNFLAFVNRFVLKKEGDDPTSWAFLYEFIRLIIFSFGLFMVEEK